MTSDFGFGTIYYIALDSVTTNKEVDCNLLDAFYSKMTSINYNQNGFLLGNLNSNNSSRKKESFKILLGEELFEKIMSKYPTLWGHLAEEMYLQYEKSWGF